MQVRNTVIMAILVVIVGSFVYFYEIHGREAREEAEEQARRLMAFEASQVAAVRVETAEGAVTARRQDDGWRIVEPVDARADDVEIDTLVEALQEAEHERLVVDEAEELEPYGLADPRIVVTVELEEGGSQSLLVGRATPVGFNVYMKRREDPSVHLVDGTAVGALEKDLHALRDKSILTFADADVRGIELRTGDYTATLERVTDDGGEEAWRLTSPLESRADADTVEELLRRLRTDDARAFVAEAAGDDELRGYGLEEPRIRLTLRAADGASRGLEIGGASEEPTGFYGRRGGSDTVFVVPSGLVDSVPGRLGALRNRAVVDVPRSRIEELEMIGGDERVRLQRTGTSWRIVEPRQLDADASAVSMLITDLVGLRADGFADAGGDLGLASPEWQVRVGVAADEGEGDEEESATETDAAAADAGGRAVTLRVGGATRVVPMDDGDGAGTAEADGDDGEGPQPVEARYVSTSEDATVYVVAAEELESLRPDLFELRKKTLVEFRQSEVTRLVVSRGDTEVTFERKEGGWRLAAPDAAELDDVQVVTDLLWDFNYLRMEGVAREWDGAAPDLSGYGLEPPAYRVRAFADDEVVADLRLGDGVPADEVAGGEGAGAGAGSQVYARVGERPAVYRIGADLPTTLEAALEAVPSGD